MTRSYVTRVPEKRCSEFVGLRPMVSGDLEDWSYTPATLKSGLLLGLIASSLLEPFYVEMSKKI